MNKITFLVIILLAIPFLACAPRSSLRERPVITESPSHESRSPVKAVWEAEWEKATEDV